MHTARVDKLKNSFAVWERHLKNAKISNAQFALLSVASRRRNSILSNVHRVQICDWKYGVGKEWSLN